MDGIYFVMVLVLSLFRVTAGGRYCFTYSGIKWCTWGCCYGRCCNYSLPGVIAAAVICGVAIIVAIAVAIFCHYQRKKRRMQTNGGVIAVSANPAGYPQQMTTTQPGFVDPGTGIVYNTGTGYPVYPGYPEYPTYSQPAPAYGQTVSPANTQTDKSSVPTVS